MSSLSPGSLLVHVGSMEILAWVHNDPLNTPRYRTQVLYTPHDDTQTERDRYRYHVTDALKLLFTRIKEDDAIPHEIVHVIYSLDPTWYIPRYDIFDKGYLKERVITQTDVDTMYQEWITGTHEKKWHIEHPSYAHTLGWESLAIEIDGYRVESLSPDPVHRVRIAGITTMGDHEMIGQLDALASLMLGGPELSFQTYVQTIRTMMDAGTYIHVGMFSSHVIASHRERHQAKIISIDWGVSDIARIFESHTHVAVQDFTSYKQSSIKGHIHAPGDEYHKELHDSLESTIHESLKYISDERLLAPPLVFVWMDEIFIGMNYQGLELITPFFKKTFHQDKDVREAWILNLAQGL